MHRRRPLLPFWFLFFVPIIYMGDLIEMILPLVFLGVVVYAIVKLVESMGESEKGNSKARTFNNGKSSSVHRSNGVSNSDLVKIDEKLKRYFENNVTLAIDDNVGLTTSNGQYTGVRQLFLTYGNEKIVRMSDFENEHPDVYQKIMEILVKFSKQKDVQKEEPAKKRNVESEPKKEERKPLSKADQFIEKINALNDAIPHEEISNGLDQTCKLLKQIDLACKDKDNDKLNKLYDYYLPILINVLNKYRSLNDSPVHGEEFNNCENELMKTIILINQALKSLYESIHEYEYMDLNADISTLQSILKKDGLVNEDPFKEKHE